ncbi:unnamed protein product [Phyllotreta striolata]|uniref:Kelch-like protein diablo n=1 Tax=Phyllotreta striolata TaxID=444603 RepID=A0A9N9XTM1_PHYSR|nr:unnamed protein product [Phyllotreta striolata]
MNASKSQSSFEGSPSDASNSNSNASLDSQQSNQPPTAASSCRDHGQVSFLLGQSIGSHGERFRCEGHAENSLAGMRAYLSTGKLCDVTLIAGTSGRRIRAHRLVLAAASEYFSAMFTGGLSYDKESEITLGEVKGDVLEAIVHYCYTGCVDIREDNAETLLSTASLMLLHEIVEACSRFLVHQLHPSNSLGIALFAEHQSCNSLLQEANSYINQHFTTIIKNQEFQQLTVEQLSNLLKNEDLNVSHEDQIFRALLTWIEFDPDNRTQHTGRLLESVKLPLLSMGFLTDHVMPICQDMSCMKLFGEAVSWHTWPDRRQSKANWRTRPRKATLGRLLVVGGMDKNKGATTIESYDPRCDAWTEPYQMNSRTLQFGMALMGTKKLLIVGGRDGLKTLNTVECLDTETGHWTQTTPMNTHRHGLGASVLGGALYAVGGHDGWSYLNSVERWDPAGRTWQYVAPMSSQRCSAGVTALGDRLYAVGGRDGTSCLRTVERYDPFTNKWTTVAPMLRRRGGVGVAAVGGYLYAVGGQDAPANSPTASRFDCVERYDPVSDTWSLISPLPSKRDAVAACRFGDKLFAIGGYDGSRYLSNVEVFDPDTQEWSSLAPLKTGRAGACVIAIGNAHAPSNNA